MIIPRSAFRPSLLCISLALLENIPAPLQAQFYYVTNQGAIIITGYYDSTRTVSIPAVINGLPVVGIDDRTFLPVDRASFITNLTIPQSVTNIGSRLIGSCFGLIAVTVDPLNRTYSTVDGVLMNKDQTELLEYPRGRPGNYTIPGTVISVRSNAFCGWPNIGPQLTGIIVSNGVRSIGDSAFEYCRSLTNATMAPSLTNLGILAFGTCLNLRTVTIPNSLLSIPGGAFLHCTALTNVVIMNGVRDISEFAFYRCYSLTSAALPDSVTQIGESTFAYCTSLTSIRTSTNLLSIGNDAFRSCYSLTRITLPNALTNIGDGAFSWSTNLTAVYFEGNAPSYIADWDAPFAGCLNATIYYLPNTTGWGDTYAGRPTAPWLPEIETMDSSFGFHSGQFGFNIRWATSKEVVVEASTNLHNPTWLPLGTNTIMDGTSVFRDNESTNYPARFYRIRSL